MKHSLRRILCLLSLLTAVASTSAHAQWTDPTPEELSMTSQAGVPGAPAVYLYREEITDDEMHFYSVYVRLKVLSESGKDYANVDLNYVDNSFNGASTTIDNIEGRTIHPDGTIIPFTGKPYDKLVAKTRDVRVMSKVFTLPDVQVGSIIEYRYKRRIADYWFSEPQWIVQTALYTRKAHFLWKPTDRQLVSSDDRGQLTSSIFWTPILPAGAEIKRQQLPSASFGHEGLSTLELNIQDVPPAPDEDHMMPVRSLTYRVLFYYSPYRTTEDF